MWTTESLWWELDLCPGDLQVVGPVLAHPVAGFGLRLDLHLHPRSRWEREAHEKVNLSQMKANTIQCKSAQTWRLWLKGRGIESQCPQTLFLSKFYFILTKMHIYLDLQYLFSHQGQSNYFLKLWRAWVRPNLNKVLVSKRVISIRKEVPDYIKARCWCIFHQRLVVQSSCSISHILQ